MCQEKIFNRLSSAKFFLLSIIFLSCSTGYKNEGDVVYYEHWNEGSGQHKNRIDADPSTFEVLKFDRYAKDDKSVFYQGEKIDGADAKTFEALDEFFARDKNSGWYGKELVKNSKGKTFSVVNSYYSTDGYDYFFTTEPLRTVNPRNFKFVHGEGDLECWTTDGSFYFYKNYKVPSEDYNNLTIYPESGGISNDKRWAYFTDRKLNYDDEGKWVVDTIDIASFRVTGFIECRDKFGCLNVYHGRVQCQE